MPDTVAELVQTLHLTRLEAPHSFRGSQVHTYFQRTYGGQVLAQALLAAYRTLDEAPDKVAHSLSAYFLRAATSERPIDYHVDRLRDGTSFATRQVRGEQGGEPVFVLGASFHVDEPGLDHALAPPPSVPPPQECPSITEVMDERFGPLPIWHEWDCLDVRFAGDSTTLPPEHPGQSPAWMRVWARTQEPLPEALPAPLHQAVLAYLSDMTLLSVSALPHGVVFISNQVQVASVGHSMWFHRPCRADHWLLYDMVSPSAHASIGFGSGRLFQDGNLVASCSQEGLVRVVEDRPAFS